MSVSLPPSLSLSLRLCACICVHRFFTREFTEDSFDNNQQKHFNKLCIGLFHIHFSNCRWQQTIDNCRNKWILPGIECAKWAGGQTTGQPANVLGKYSFGDVLCTSNYQICLIISVKRVFVDSLVARWSHRKYSLFPFAFDLFAILLLCWYLIFDVRMIYAWKIWLNSHYLQFYRHRKRSHLARTFDRCNIEFLVSNWSPSHTFQSGIWFFFQFLSDSEQNKTKLYFNWKNKFSPKTKRAFIQQMKKNQVQD